jgi:hypothetical protein
MDKSIKTNPKNNAQLEKRRANLLNEVRASRSRTKVA